jgi:hypothetical protein
MFWAMFLPILRSNLTACTALVQCTDLLPTGDMVETEQFHLNRVTSWQQVGALYQSCTYS